MIETAVYYLFLSVILVLYLSFLIIKQRKKHLVSVGSGGHDEIKYLMRAHGNALEYLPLFLIMLCVYDANDAPAWAVHLFGMMMMVGRVLHAIAFVKYQSMALKIRFWGMILTFLSLILVAIANIIAVI